MQDSRRPDPDAMVLRKLLDRYARERPDAIFASFEDGSQCSWRSLYKAVRGTAAALQKLGVDQGDHVLCWLPNGRRNLEIWFAINYIGAVYMPLNLDYRGGILGHAVQLSDARLLIAHSGLVERLADIDTATLEVIATIDGKAEGPADLRRVGPEALVAAEDDLMPLKRPIEPWDVQSIILTSGTTGPSKAVLSSYCHLASLCGRESWGYVTDSDRFLINLPLFHIGGLSCIYAMLIRGASIAMIERFTTDNFWTSVRRTGSTVVGLMGAMTPFLVAAPPSAEDRNHGLRVAVIIPLSGDIAAFADRFGVEVYTVYNMTEISTPLISDRNPTEPGLCGRPRPGVEVRLVDENDIEVCDGVVGELVIRTDLPWALNSGYYKEPAATAAAWRNGWFHTGDSFRRDPRGIYFFVDRRKDAIRRRGENISSFEVEVEVAAHPAIEEVAAYAVASKHGEDDVMIAVVARDGMTVDESDLIRFLITRMPRFMVPRYVRIMAELPKTPTAKIQKHLLRADGTGEGTFDRETAGIRIERSMVSRRDA